MALTQVKTAGIAADAVTGAKIADDQINSEHYVDGSIDNAHVADDQINSEHYAAASIDNEHLADDAVDSDELAAGAVDIAHLSASGTAGNTTYLRGDNTWATVSSGISDVVSDTSPQLGGTLDTNGQDINFTSGGETKYFFDASQSRLEIADNCQISFGAHPDVSMAYLHGNDFGITANHNGSGDIVIGTTNLAGTILNSIKSVRSTQAVELYYDNSKKFETTSAGATVTGTLTADLADDSIDSKHYVDGSIDHVHLADDSVDSDNIMDNSVGLAGLANMGRGALITGDAISDPKHLAAGCDDQVLTMDANGDFGWEDAAGGGLSNSATGSDNVLGGTNAGADIQAGAERNTLLGSYAGRYLTTGDDNIAIGSSAFIGSNSTAVTGSKNIAIGSYALDANTTGASCVAVGYAALTENSEGLYNVAVGQDALGDTTTGDNNVGIGYKALELNSTANSNTAVGSYALDANQTGQYNCAFGHNALTGNTGSYNTAMGYNSLSAATGQYCVGIGPNAGAANTADNNVFIGYNSGDANTSGSSNTAIG